MSDHDSESEAPVPGAPFRAFFRSAGGFAAVGLLAVSRAASGHHAFAAEFDADKPIDISGVVTKARWVNPHSWLYLDVKAPDGSVTNWGVEFGTPNALAGRGLKKEDLLPGTAVRVKGFRAKNGGPYGYSVTVTLPDGRSVQTGGAPDNPGTGAAGRQ